MTLTRGLLVYIKIPLLIVLVGTFYWRDFFARWQTLISTGWVILALPILFLVFVFLFQRRNALKTLISISETHNSQGAGFVLLALLLYVVGSYTQYALWLHLCSLILFIAGYLALIIDFRIPRMLFLPLVALLLVVPPIGIEVSEVQNLLALVVLVLSIDAVIVALVANIKSSSKRGRMKASGFFKQTSPRNNETKSVYCPLCQSDMFKEEVFCFHCGRQRLQLKLKPFKFAFMKFLVLLLIVLVLSFVYLPTFSLADREASLMSYTSHGIEEQTIIPNPEGWKLESSERLVDYERERLEDYVVVATYIAGGFSENRSYIQLEIGSRSLYMRNGWKPSDWQRSRQDFALTEFVRGRYVVLQKGNDSITVLYWTMKLVFRVGSVFSTRNVGVSVFSNFAEPITQSKAVEVLAEFRRVGISIINWWDFVSRWTLNLYSISEIYVRFRDAFLTVVSVAAVLVFAGWVRPKDDRVCRVAELAFLLSDDEARLLLAVSKMKQRKFRGVELFDEYERLVRNECAHMDISRFYGLSRKFLELGLLGRDYVVGEDDELRMVWVRNLP